MINFPIGVEYIEMENLPPARPLVENPTGIRSLQHRHPSGPAAGEQVNART